MSENWRQVYETIIEYIADHPAIKIEPSCVKINAADRPQFNQLFWAAREAFLREKSKALIDEVEILCRNYLAVEEEVTKLLGLEGISLFHGVDNILHNPVDTLIKGLRYPLLDLLKGLMDIDEYEKEASKTIVSSFEPLYQQGYEIWVVLSLIKLMEANKSFRVDADEFDDDEYFSHGPGDAGVKVPEPKELKVLSFRHNPIIGLLVADQIVHSAKLGQYFSFRPNIVEPVGEANNKNMKMEWLPLPVLTIRNISSNVILVYMDRELDDLPLIADIKSVRRPDLIIECLGLKKMFDEKGLAKTKKYNEDFKPRLGTYVISNEVVIENIHEGQEEAIHFLPVGFDQSKLEQIINLFSEMGNVITTKKCTK